MSYADRLKNLGKQWDKDQATKGNGGALPAGKYQLQIKTARLEEGKASFNKGHVQVAITFVVAVGNLKGRTAMKWFDLEAPAKDNIPSGISMFKGFLESIGLDIPSQLSEKNLTALCKELIGIICNCSVVVNAKGYANIYINSAVNSSDASSDDEENSDTEDAEDNDDDDDSDDDDDDTDDDDVPAPKVKPKKPQPAGGGSPSKPVKPPKDEEEDADDWND